MPTLYRVALTCRRPVLDAFEATIRRPYLSAQKGIGPLDQVWRTAVRAECAAPDELRFGSFQWDLEKFYERLQHPRLIAHAAKLALPLALVRTTIRAYRPPPHHMSHKSACSGCIRSHVGVVAGCAAATTWAKIGLLHATDSVFDAIPRQVDCQVSIYIDDFDVTVRAPTNRQVVRNLAQAAQLRVQHVEICEHVPFALPKATVIADCAQLACQIRTALGPSGGKPCAHATILGVDTVAGRSRCATIRNNRRQRMTRCSARRTRLRRFAATVPSGRATKFFVSGIRPAATYGAQKTGVSPAPLRTLRQLAARTLRPKAQGRSLTAVSLLHGDPAGRVGYTAAARWALEAWGTVAHDPDAISLPHIASAYYSTRAEARSATWRTARGPIAVAALELQRLGWPWPTPFEYADPDGTSYSLFDLSPCTIRHHMHLATLHGLARQLARAPGPSRVLYEPVDRLMHTRSLNPQQKWLIASVFAGAVAPHDRLRRAKYEAPAECEPCGPELGHADSLHHRLWLCPHPIRRRRPRPRKLPPLTPLRPLPLPTATTRTAYSPQAAASPIPPCGQRPRRILKTLSGSPIPTAPFAPRR